ncbi:MAG: LysM peptidoglycan-binding domain-containing protein [Pirellulales bacterium]|nr:LysM peptidoglycan-binding domain-containing protein [Pirellulales bacterium]
MLNQIKTFLVMAVLAAASYGVYVLIWHKPVATTTTAQENPAPQPPVITPPNTSLTNPPAPLAPPTPSPKTSLLPESTPDGGVAAKPDPTAPIVSPGTEVSAPPDNVPPIISPAPLVAGPATAPGDPADAESFPPLDSSVGATSAEMTTAPPGEGLFQDRFAAFMEAVWKTLDEGHLAEAHLALSKLYEEPNLPETQRRQVTELLDQLAGTVIYSRQHLLEPPYVVRPGETLEQIAEQYQVPALLLARINGISDAEPLEPGRELKVLRGPFHAVVHLERHELTLLVEGRYAGRFTLGVGMDCPKLEGQYTVHEKIVAPVYRGPDGQDIPPSDYRNPLGKYWIGLSPEIGLHGTNDPQNVGRDNNAGTLCLGNRDIDDLYGILSIGSRVVIQR